jgi:hypothetical protein
MAWARLLPIVLPLLAGSASAASTRFGFKQIVIAGSTNVSAVALNNSTSIAGVYGDGTGLHGFIKAGGAVIVLPPPIANCGCVAFPTAVNAGGDVVGSATYGQTYGFLWHQGAYVTAGSVVMGTGGGSDPVIGINKAGQEIFDSYTGDGIYAAYAGAPGNFTALTPPGSFPFVDNINAHGVVAGQSSPLGPEVFIESAGTYTEIEPPGALDSAQGFINDRGQVAGLFQDSTGAQRGFVFHAGKYTIYDFPHGPGTIEIDGINNAGRVVGVYLDPVKAIRRGFLFNGTTLSAFGQYGAADDVHVAINDAGTMLVSDYNGATGTYSSHRVLCAGPGC